MTHEDRIAAILGKWQEERDQGRLIDTEALCAEHPDVADELRIRLAALNVIEQAFAESRILEGETPKRLGEFEIVREIGRGGMGVVYEARQMTMSRTVALKVLFPGVTGSRRAIERFQREARAAGRVQHTNIVPVYHLSREDGTWYYAMELVEGSSLATLLHQLREFGDRQIIALLHKTEFKKTYEPRHQDIKSLATVPGFKNQPFIGHLVELFQKPILLPAGGPD